MSYIVAPQKKLKEPIPVPGTKEKVTDLVIIHDQTKCTGCGQCMIGCAYKHFRTFDRRFGLLYVYEDPINKGPVCERKLFALRLPNVPRLMPEGSHLQG